MNQMQFEAGNSMNRWHGKVWGAGWVALLPLLFASAAQAQTACGDEMCPKGFSCQSVPAPCPAIDCQDAADCPPCAPSERQQCLPADCTSDADCGTDMLCVTSTHPCGVAVPACPPGAECAAPLPAECAPTTSSQCVPRWQLPCQQSADCGPGFECVELAQCSVPPSGPRGGAGPGAGAQPNDPNAPSQPTPPERVPSDTEITCEPSGEFACKLLEVACASNADCQSGWSCADNPEGVCSSSSTGETVCSPGDPPKLCLPPYGYHGRGVTTGSGSVAQPDNSSAPGAGPQTPTAGSPSTGSPPAANPEVAYPELGSPRGGTGCSVSGLPVHGGAVGWLVLGLSGLFGLRRRQNRS